MSVVTAASGLSYQAIRQYAERIGEHYGIYDSAGMADIHGLVARLGGTVEVSDRPESLHVDREGSFVIIIPSTTSMRRDRFTLAHELGHYFLHYLFPKREGSASFGRGSRNRAETEANTFASSLLMPTEAFRDAHRIYQGNVRALANVFDVSPAAAQVRMSVLGLS